MATKIFIAPVLVGYFSRQRGIGAACFAFSKAVAASSGRFSSA
jgi:hypothetical protein